MELFSRTFLVNMALALSMGCALINGIDLAFNVYSTEIKITFNLTQTQVEVLASLDGIGMGLGILEIPIYLRFGYRVSFIITWLMMSLASGFLSLSAFANETVVDFIWVIFIAQLIMATGNSMSFMVMTRAVLEACPTVKTGIIVAMFFGMTSFGKIVIGILMDFHFTGNLAGFFATFCVVSTVVLSGCFGLLDYLLKTKETCQQGITYDADGKSNLIEDKSSRSPSIECDENNLDECVHQKKPVKITTLKEMFKSSFFHWLFWPILFCYAIPFTIMNNITTIVISQNVSNPLNTVYILASTIFATRVICGLIKDKFLSMATGFILIIFGDFAMILGIVLCFFYLEPITVYIMSVLVGISLGSGVTVCIAMLMDRYGKQHFGALSGIHYAVSSVTLTLWQLLFGFVYDSNKPAGGHALFCYIGGCFYMTFLVMFIFVGVMTIVQMAHFIYTWITRLID